MDKILLVGNGLTANLVSDYKDQAMMKKVKRELPGLWSKANDLFEPFRLRVDTVQCRIQAYGYCGSRRCGEPWINGPILDRPYNDSILLHIEKILNELEFYNAQRLSEDLFQRYGLIFETQRDEISNLENLLKVVSLFYERGDFSEDDKARIKEVANIIYYNDGRCGKSTLDSSTLDHLERWLSTYDMIFTANFDCILDEVLQKNTIRHLHGGFFYSEKNKCKRCDTRVSPEEACLIWGIGGKEKEKEMDAGGGFEFPFSGEIEFSATIFREYLLELREVDAERIDVFGYSGENDQHINDAIAENNSIQEVHYYCAPDEAKSQAIAPEIRLRFHIEPPKKLVLESWDNVWKQLR